ncbi:glutamate synthase large subunit [Halorutilales archaeon Cl-col2-1]
MSLNSEFESCGLYDSSHEHDNCGVGVLMNLSGEKSHEIVEDALEMLESLDHRGARGAEENTGDGSGILIQKPHGFFESEVEEIEDLGFDSYGVGQVFFPDDEEKQPELRDLIENAAEDEGFEVFAWRNVPTDNSDLGETALESEPDVKQFFVRPQEDVDTDEIDSGLYVLRRVIENRVEEEKPAGEERFYICSLDRRKVVYKGLLTNAQVRSYYRDLSDGDVVSSLALVHSRFSTNTLGAWELAHPYRSIVHNGEINTLRGNFNWMKAREADLESPAFGDDIDKLKPVTEEGQSDTAVLDNVLELLVESGRSLPESLRMLIPEAWDKDESIDDDRKDWYDYHSSIVEPWDGPALVAFTDGYSVGAVLDRNGLRPCRYYVTEDDRLVMASEAGVLDTPPEDVEEKGRLQPGQMFLADADEGRIIPDEEVFDDLTDEKYSDWLDENRVSLEGLVDEKDPVPEYGLGEYGDYDISRYQRTFGYSLEHVERLIQPMAEEGKDPIGAMGNDTPPSVLSERNKTLFTYFKQLFAQVTNPPLDYIREETVTSLRSNIGRQNNILGETPEHCRQLTLDSPVLRNEELEAVKRINQNGIKSYEIDVTYEKGKDLRKAVEEVRHEAVRAITDGYELLVLSDRKTSEDRVPIPSLLVTGAVHHHLIREGLRTRVGLVLETGQPCGVQHFCTLIGYGADAVNPYLAYDTIHDLILDGDIEFDPDEAIDKYVHAVEDGLLKVMSKMGISTLESYKGAQIFEAIGLDSEFVDEYFEGTTARTEGIGIEDLEEDLLERHELGFGETVEGNLELEQGGEFYWRRDGEFHQWNPQTIGKLQHAAQSDDYETYKEFSSIINQQEENLQTLRGLLEFDTENSDSIPIEEVEPVEEICKRFFSSSMSFGSLSKEVHETLAIAMNRIGGKAGSGEGGEPVERFNTEKECKLKQVASGRFGVTSNYLKNAEGIEIKMAQGSKPGEGGHLPGGKVNETIAETRYTTPGVDLISPPPHHDIYSIEDLAQLIHDLKCSNTDADVHVKLVSEAGIGTIAAGVSKAKADALLISGESGGTGASPKTSIKSAGLPWELGLAEANQVLLANDLRSRIKLRVDGGMKTGRDIAVAALLGAEEYGFGTAPLITCGCVMLRKCHANTCSVGVATQDPDLRDRFPGRPEFVVNYMRFMAQEVREIMADLGFKTMEEMIGSVDKLKHNNDVEHPKAQKVDLSQVLELPESEDEKTKTVEQNHKIDEKLDNELIEEAKPALEDGESVEIERKIENRNRTLGTMLSAEVAERYGDDGLPDDTIKLDLEGSAGQSLGAFLSHGMTIDLDGDANDYLGKGLSGGKIIVRTPDEAEYEADDNILIGNVALYGATRGEAYFNGVAGERFAVRNSGVKTVVEGVGDHGCEYMTGGIAVILGETGKNFGAGMSGGEAYVLDESGDFESKVNKGMVHIDEFDDRDEHMVKRMVENHHRYTGSEKAREILDNWDEYVDSFVKVMPDPYADAIEERLEEGEDIRVSPPPKPPQTAERGRGDD